MQPRPRLPLATARAVDRLARRAHAFHRFAHHPLCGRYAGEVLRLGARVRVCRGCAAVGCGGALGALAGAVGVGSGLMALGAGLVAAGVGVLSLRVRLPKLLGRFLPAFAGGAGVAGALRVAPFVAAGLAAAAVMLVLLYRQRQPDRSPCLTCPERTSARPCSGYAPIVRRERAFRRVAQRVVDRACSTTPVL